MACFLEVFNFGYSNRLALSFAAVVVIVAAIIVIILINPFAF